MNSKSAAQISRYGRPGALSRPPAEVDVSSWNEFRLGVLPAYEGLVKSLRRFDVHVPSLRPSNATRSCSDSRAGSLPTH